MTKVPELFTMDDIEDIKQAIMLAELDTSAEIRVHIETEPNGNCETNAAECFLNYTMNRTKEKNGLLIYLALTNRRFCIHYDEGIRKIIPPDFWVVINQKFLTRISSGNYVEGIIEVIQQTGAQLKKFFPRKPGDINQLADEVTFS
ncbi:MAG TPA: TPM domain-containing protein [Bacteroidales bacterium]|nr:TPM domain-containing protein [Bacteroidales bacterium]